jgi:hypothetical protein
MRRALFPILAGLLLIPASVLADEVTDAADILAARKFAEPIMGKQCEFKYDEKGVPEGDNNVFHLTFRTKGQDQDSPDYKRTLVQLSCYAAAYNFSAVYLLRNDDKDEGGWELLTFAEPTADYDYADEYFSKLKAPPKVTGYVTSTQMVNSEFDDASKTITATAKWRGIGDSWSAGEWQFVEGAFVLKRYEIDPTQQVPEGQEENPNQPESYVLFGEQRPEEPAE